MQLFLQHTLDGLTFAGLLFLLGSGFGLTFGLLGIANLTHGSAFLVGGYVGYSTLNATGSFVLAALAGAAAMGVAGLLLERSLLRRLHGDETGQFLLTVGVTFIAADLALLIWGGDPLSVRLPDALSGNWQLGSFIYPWSRIFILGVAAVIAVLLWLLLARTRTGALIRAGVDNREMVSALGVNIGRIFTLVFVLGMALAGLAGVLGGSFLSLGPGGDWEVIVFVFAVVIIGGKGTFAGPLVGSLVVGLVTTYGNGYFPEFSYFSLFAPMALIMLWRPQGLFGRGAPR